MSEQNERTKRFILKIEDENERTVTARFATFDVVDLDGDLTEKGAFGEQDVFMGPWNHNPQMLPPGMGKTREDGDGAFFDGAFFESTSGQEHYELIKAAGGQMEWSYRFFIEDGSIPIGDENEDGPFFIIRRAKITHVAPVEAGAGIGTETVDVKCVGCQSKDQVNIHGKVYGLEDFEKAVDKAIAKVMARQKGCGGKCGGDCKCGSAGDDPDGTKDAGDDQIKGENLGALLRGLRDQKELTNEDLAQAAGLAISTIGQILGGTLKCPKVDALQGMARALEVNLSSLVLAAEKDGCDDFSGEKTQDNDQAADKDADGSNDTQDVDLSLFEGADGAKAQNDADDADADDAAKDIPSDSRLAKEIDALLTGYPGLPEEDDAGLVAYQNYRFEVPE